MTDAEKEILLKKIADRMLLQLTKDLYAQQQKLESLKILKPEDKRAIYYDGSWTVFTVRKGLITP